MSLFGSFFSQPASTSPVLSTAPALSAGPPPFTAQVSPASTTDPLEELGGQLAKYGFDIRTLPVPIRILLQRAANPSTRTVHVLTELMEQLMLLRGACQERLDFIAFTHSRAHSVEEATYLQRLYEQNCGGRGPKVQHKLIQSKSTMPEESRYYCCPIIGFEGLLARMKQQKASFESLAFLLKDLQEIQNATVKTLNTIIEQKVKNLHESKCRLQLQFLNVINKLEAYATVSLRIPPNTVAQNEIENRIRSFHKMAVGLPESNLNRAAQLEARIEVNIVDRSLQEKGTEKVSTDRKDASLGQSFANLEAVLRRHRKAILSLKETIATDIGVVQKLRRDDVMLRPVFQRLG